MDAPQLKDIIGIVGSILGAIAAAWKTAQVIIKRGAEKQLAKEDAEHEQQAEERASQNALVTNAVTLADAANKSSHAVFAQLEQERRLWSEERAEWNTARKEYHDQIAELQAEVRSLKRIVTGLREQLDAVSHEGM
jgi:enoyl-[acyl-carrier-protein] reductase (NADH)